MKWDELRRKVANIQPKLPSGASTITVNDDFGDVYGIYYALTADEDSRILICVTGPSVSVPS